MEKSVDLSQLQPHVSVVSDNFDTARDAEEYENCEDSFDRLNKYFEDVLDVEFTVGYSDRYCGAKNNFYSVPMITGATPSSKLSTLKKVLVKKQAELDAFTAAVDFYSGIDDTRLFMKAIVDAAKDIKLCKYAYFDDVQWHWRLHALWFFRTGKDVRIMKTLQNVLPIRKS